MRRETAAIKLVELDARRPSIPEDLATTSRTVLEAHDGQLRTAIASVRWVRRGVLQKLTRVAEPEACDGCDPLGPSGVSAPRLPAPEAHRPAVALVERVSRRPT
jgi:hypothetical protein